MSRTNEQQNAKVKASKKKEMRENQAHLDALSRLPLPRYGFDEFLARHRHARGILALLITDFHGWDRIYEQVKRNTYLWNYLKTLIKIIEVLWHLRDFPQEPECLELFLKNIQFPEIAYRVATRLTSRIMNTYGERLTYDALKELPIEKMLDEEYAATFKKSVADQLPIQNTIEQLLLQYYNEKI